MDSCVLGEQSWSQNSRTTSTKIITFGFEILFVASSPLSPVRPLCEVFSPRKHIAFFAVLVDVESLSLNLRRDAQPDRRFDQAANDGRSDTRDQDCNRDGFQLSEPQSVTG